MKGGSVWGVLGLVLDTILVKSDSSLNMNTGAKWHNGLYDTESLLLPYIHIHGCCVVMPSCRVGSGSLLMSWVQLKKIRAFLWHQVNHLQSQSIRYFFCVIFFSCTTKQRPLTRRSFLDSFVTFSYLGEYFLSEYFVVL